MPVGRGNTPFVDYLRALADVGYRGAASVELEFPANPAEIVEWVAEARAGAARVLAGSGLRPDMATDREGRAAFRRAPGPPAAGCAGSEPFVDC
jgi:hypothetical protein